VNAHLLGDPTEDESDVENGQDAPAVMSATSEVMKPVVAETLVEGTQRHLTIPV